MSSTFFAKLRLAGAKDLQSFMAVEYAPTANWTTRVRELPSVFWKLVSPERRLQFILALSFRCLLRY
jgi:hypothetical protein